MRNTRVAQRNAGKRLRPFSPTEQNPKTPKVNWGADTLLDKERMEFSIREKKKASIVEGLTTQTFKRIEPAVRSFYYSQCPPENPKLPEIAVFGISNVGKSSFINYFCNRRLLSTVSKHPGHTRLIHHFLIDRSWYLVDLPGVGFADAPGKVLKSMDKMITAYLRHRATLIQLLYLVDASEPPQQLDLEAIKWLVESEVFVTIVFTKTDIRRKATPPDPVMAMTRALTDMPGSPFRLGIKEVPAMFLTSSKAKTGREPVLDFLMELRERATPRSLMKPKEVVVPRGSVEMVVTDKKGRRKTIEKHLVPEGVR
jgi:GTP-binding protein